MCGGVWEVLWEDEESEEGFVEHDDFMGQQEQRPGKPFKWGNRGGANWEARWGEKKSGGFVAVPLDDIPGVPLFSMGRKVMSVDEVVVEGLQESQREISLVNHLPIELVFSLFERVFGDLWPCRSFG